jgi:quinol monooxygenase YgiN
MQRRRLFALLSPLLLGGFSIATPWRPRPPAAGEPALLAVSLTHAVLHADRREPFDRATRAISAALPAQPGLVGYRLRRQLFGNEVWTLSAWISEAARADFVRSPAHQTAMRDALPAIAQLRMLRLQRAREQLPLAWSEVEALLAQAPQGDEAAR